MCIRLPHTIVSYIVHAFHLFEQCRAINIIGCINNDQYQLNYPLIKLYVRDSPITVSYDYS